MSGPILDPGLYEGVVINVMPAEMCVDVIVDSLAYSETLENVPLLASLGDAVARGGSSVLPKVGTPVIVAVTNNGVPFVQGCLPTYSDRFDTSQDPAEKNSEAAGAELLNSGQETFGFSYVTEDPIFKSMGEESYRLGRPSEVLPGDWVQYGTEGNLLGVLEGGVTVLKAGDTSQIQAFKHSDKIKISARRFEVFTDFGELVFASDKGSTSFKVRGSVSAEKAHPKSFDPDCFLEFGTSKFDSKGNLTSGGGEAYLKIGTKDIFLEFKDGKVTKGGEVFERANAGSAAPREDTEVLIEGNLSQSVEGSLSVQADLGVTLEGDASIEVTSGTSMSVSSGSDMDISTTGGRRDQVSGWSNPLKDGPPLPARVGYGLEVPKGDVVIEVGEYALKEVLPGPSSAVFIPSFRVNSYNGDIKMACYGVGGSILLSAPTPPSKLGSGVPGMGITLDSPTVMLGSLAAGVPNPPHGLPGKPAVPQPVTLWPGLYAWMMTVSHNINMMSTALSGHTHPGTGPDPISTPLLVGVGPAVTTATASVAGSAMSKTVFAGG